MLAGFAAAGTLPAAGPDPLAAFRAALRRAGERGGIVDVLQFGDSHTANDSFSGRLRELFQARWGDAGRGFLPPAIPHDWYRPNGVAVSAEGWQLLPGPGLAPLRARAVGRAGMTVRTETPDGLSRLALDALAQPGGGTLDARADTGAGFALRTAGHGPLWAAFAAPGARELVLTARGDGPVDLLGLRVATGRSGVSWSNLGFPGATVALTARWDPAVSAAEARALDPSLLVLAFGTNEAFKDGTDLPEYRTSFAARLQALRALAPAASVLVILPPAGLRRGDAGCPDGWGPPPLLAPIRRIQLDAARAQGAATWDWSAASGGTCSMLPLMRTVPPAAAPDGVHFLRPGYRDTAERLFAFLTAGMG